MFRAMSFSVAAAATCVVGSQTLASGIEPTSQIRTVETSASATSAGGADFDASANMAPDFAPFNVSISSLAAPDGGGMVSSAADQRSLITAFCIKAAGAASFDATQCQGVCFMSNAEASSVCTVEFVVEAPIGFTLQGMLTTIASPELPWGSATFSFSGPGGTYASALVNDFATPAMPALSGLLPVGTYVIAVSAQVAEEFDIPDLSGATYDLTFMVTTCMGDLDGTNGVDGADLGILLSAWGTNDGAADLDCNGVVDGADLGAMLAAWGPCAPIASDCCGPGVGKPGCDTPPCELCVCAQDPFCCDVRWDDICASQAAEDCPTFCVCGG